jgi:TolA-binding protein
MTIFHRLAVNFAWMALILPATVHAQARNELESYVQDHFDTIYRKLENVDQQSLRLLEIQRQIEAVNQENRLLRSQMEEMQRELRLIPNPSSASSGNAPTTSAPRLAPSGLTSPSNSPPEFSALTESSVDKQALAQARLAMGQGKFDTAADLLTPLTASKVTEVAIESQYWLGLSLISQNNCPRGMAYLRSFTLTNPDHPLAPDGYLAYALCQQKLGQDKGYQATISHIKKSYPQSTAAKKIP